MLRNTRIRTRLALMAAAPAITALVLVIINAVLLPSILIGGTSYREILTGKDFQASTVTPSLYIVDIHTKVQSLTINGLAGRAFDQEQSDVTALIKQYETAYSRWTTQSQLTDPRARAELIASHKAAEDYFAVYRTKLLPAVQARRSADAANIFDTNLSSSLYFHQQHVERAAKIVGDQVVAQEAAVDERTQRQTIGIVAVTVLVVALSIALGVTILRSITDRVRRLNEIATIELPQVLGEVRRAALAGEEIPSLPQPTGDSGDELAAAANAFNAVVATAVDLAAEQSRLRRATSQMFINLGRRNHKLLSRTLTYITQLESDERDPATLQNLFRLDHLTTRMRRHAESLLVLAGSPPLRTWSRPVPIADVLRAALSEIETYDRVDVKELEPVEVRGASVSDLAHLLAELLENATAFSPPQTRVRVLGRTDTDGYTVVVVDEGIGMSAEELAAANRQVQAADDSSFFGDSRMLGLGVVGRLAARHGFGVSLTASPVGGVVAWVTLSLGTLAPRRGAEGDAGPIESARPAAPALPFGDALPRQQAGGAGAPGVPAPGARPSGPPARPGLTEVVGRADERVSRPTGPLPSSPAPERNRPAPAAQPEPAASSFAEPTSPQAPPAPGTPSAPAHDAPGAPAAPAARGGEPELVIDLRGVEERPAFTAPARPAPADPFARPGVADPVTRPVTTTNGVAAANGTAAPGAAASGGLRIPPAPVSGSIAFRPAPAGPGVPGGLTRRVRGAQLPDTGDAPSAAAETARPDRSAQSVRGALQSFAAGRRSATDVTLGNTRPSTAPIDLGRGAPASPAGPAPVAPAAPVQPSAAPAAPARPAAENGGALPRRVRGAQLPATDLPESAPAPGRSAAEVRAALTNFVAGRRAAEHQD